jgi:cell division protein FtsB
MGMSYRTYMFLAALLLVAGVAGYVLLPAYREYAQTKNEQEQLQSTLLEQQMQSDELRGEIHAIQNDPKAVERVAREKFGWCREDERVYHFEPPPSTERPEEGR